MAQHPEFRILKQDGAPVEKLSYAYPEVRAFTLSIIREAADRFDIDGVNIGFVRLNKCLGWEPPVAEAFRAQYGEEAHEAPDGDERLFRVRSRFLHQFVQDARKLLDEVGEKKGRRLELSAWVWPGNGSFDMDYRTMVQEKLLDSIILHSGGEVDQELLAACKANGCPYLLFPAGGVPGNFQILLDGYAQGIDGMAQWDIDGLQENFDWWKFLKVAGSPDELAKVLAAPPSPPERKLFTLHKINGKSVSGRDLWQSCYAGG